jgi:hypothetical protein
LVAVSVWVFMYWQESCQCLCAFDIDMIHPRKSCVCRLGFYVALLSITSQINLHHYSWFATANPETRYLINEIVLAEETDTTIDGHHQSHYEMYLEAMESCGRIQLESIAFIWRAFFAKHFVATIKINHH